ncbi:hypothetical protein [Desulfosporosinus sp. FKA]|uniref:hypothetical protein n=1 Tax=Desulfosporosinus sp. FKA TaxID=1969834 RepID=UPI000B4A4730|nr:hypothetical protein [Desulfosporosinus sp. FKA]
MVSKLKWFIIPGVITALLLLSIAFIPVFALAGNGPDRFYNNQDSGSSDGGSGIPSGGAIPPADLQFHEVNPDDLRNFLSSQGSYLTRDVDSFITNGRTFNVNPLLLVAITGQEQSFDPARNSDAAQVERNPFNVYGSWMAYSPGFNKACEVAARTVATKLSYPIPSGEDPIQWINDPKNPSGSYAEDLRWWKGVKFWFQTLSSRPNSYLVPLTGTTGGKAQ